MIGNGMPAGMVRRIKGRMGAFTGTAVLNRLRAIAGRDLIVVVASAHKVGSTWLFNLVKDAGRFRTGRIPQHYNSTGTIDLDRDGAYGYLEGLEGFHIFKSHSKPAANVPSGKLRMLTILRDPRDVLVSASFYLANLDEARGGWGNEFKRLSPKERMVALIGKGDFLIDKLDLWHKTDTAFKVKYEELRRNPAVQLGGVLEYLGIRCGRRTVNAAIAKHSFKAQTGRNPGNGAEMAFLRKGISGDWKNYFDDEVTESFKNGKDGRWNRLLVDMHYEDALDW